MVAIPHKEKAAAEQLGVVESAIAHLVAGPETTSSHKTGLF